MKKAVTLVELIVSVAVTVVVLTAVFAVFYTGRVSFFTNSTRMELAQTARTALQSMKNELLQTRVSLVSVPADGNYYNSITFKLPDSIDSNGVISWSSNITYFLNNNQVTRTQDSGSRVLATDITGLQFRIDSSLPRVLEIYVTASKNNPAGQNFSVNMDTSLRLRN